MNYPVIEMSDWTCLDSRKTKTNDLASVNSYITKLKKTLSSKIGLFSLIESKLKSLTVYIDPNILELHAKKNKSCHHKVASMAFDVSILDYIYDSFQVIPMSCEFCIIMPNSNKSKSYWVYYTEILYKKDDIKND